MSGSDGRLRKLEVNADGRIRVRERYVEDGFSYGPVSPSFHPRVMCPEGVEQDAHYALGLHNRR
jgi:hypothetical protein